MTKLLLLITILFASYQNAYAASIPQFASGLSRDLNRQLSNKLGFSTNESKNFSLIMSTPVNLNNLEQSSPLARQLQEELSQALMQQGYSIQELRKGQEILFDPRQGELLLTRRTQLLQQEAPESTAILAGTYTVSSKNVRFNIKIIETASLNVLAIANITIPLSPEIHSLLGSAVNAHGFTPSVYTSLP